MPVKELYAYIHVDDPARAIDFYAQAFGAHELFRLTEPGGRIGHAEMDFAGTTLMLSGEYPEMGIQGPRPGSATSVTLHLHVDDADQMIARALAAGATLVRPAQDHFYGERSGTIRDPFGHRWLIGHATEEVTPAEMQRRYDSLFE
jgi:PhnB protein